VPHPDVNSLLDFEEVNDEAIEEVLSLAPFGYGNPSPVFAVRDAEAASGAMLSKEKHLRVPLRQNGRSLRVKAWHFAERRGDGSEAARGCTAVL
jgi:single-stranded-DNA-specific exonuclease